MKQFLLVFLTSFSLALHAQVPTFQVPPHIPSFLDLRTEPPFRAVIAEKTVTPNSFSLTLKSGTATKTYSVTGPDEDTMKVVRHLVVGQEYAFPAVFDKILGPRKPGATPPSPPVVNSGNPMLGLLDLPTCEPFRARVVSKELKADEVFLELERTDGFRMSMKQSGTSGFAEARRIALLLEAGGRYEFPDAVLPSTNKEKAPATEPMPEMEPMAGWIGEWEKPQRDPAAPRMFLSLEWKKDGRGIWKTMRGEKPGVKSITTEWLITYDSARKCFVEKTIRAGVIPREIDLKWDSKTRAFTVHAEAVAPQRGPTIWSGKRVLTTPDHIEWDMRLTTKTGQVVEEGAGEYTRVAH